MNWTAARFRAENAGKDLRDRLRGRCCRAPLYMVEGGYHFWRCGLRRRHAGPCRSGNYLWGPGGSIFAPTEGRWVDVGSRKATETYRQRRWRRRWHAMADAKRSVPGEAKAVDAGDY